jgi:hypothetical protein
MKIDNDIYDKQLKNLFEAVHLESPSTGFTENLMRKIEKEVGKEKRKNKCLAICGLAASSIGILLAPVFAFYLSSRFIPEFSFSFPEMNIHFDPIILIIGFSILLLLMADTLFRKHF